MNFSNATDLSIGAANKTAVDKFARRSAISGATALSSQEWAKVENEIKERIFFSANVGNAKILTKMKSKIEEALSLSKESGVVIDRNRFVVDMKDFLSKEGYALGGHSVKDLTSNARLKLIYNMNKTEALEYARYKRDCENKVRLNMYPAWEFKRLSPRNVERDWKGRWIALEGKVYGNRLIALKNSPIWKKLSVFGRPWAPFDFNSGFGCVDISRSECLRLGLIKKNEIIESPKLDYNDEATLSNTDIGDYFIKKMQLEGIVGKNSDKKISIRPNAHPVSDALDVRITNKELKSSVNEAIRIINTVHGDGALPTIPIITERSTKMLGAFWRHERAKGDVAVKITLKKGPWTKLTTIHEIGHFLDNQGLGNKRLASATGKINKLMNVIYATDEYKQLVDLEKKKPKKYWSSETECFARAYAQFIAKESGEKSLLAELELCRTKRLESGIPAQWSDESFEPIHKEMKALFKEKGWLR